jgi:hypothetical protein
VKDESLLPESASVASAARRIIVVNLSLIFSAS